MKDSTGKTLLHLAIVADGYSLLNERSIDFLKQQGVNAQNEGSLISNAVLLAARRCTVTE